MSVEITVCLSADRLPSPKVWQEAISANGFAVELDTDFDPVEFSGFLPARYQGGTAGFEYYNDSESEGEARISLRWGGDLREAASGIIAAACLCHLAGGHVEDTESGEIIQAQDVIAWARSQEAELQQAMAQESKEPSAPLPRPWWKFW
jgi:hypothetical protein